MGGRFSRKRKNQLDPNFSPYYEPGYPGAGPGPGGYPPPYPYGGAGFDPYGGEYDPNDIYGYGYPPTDTYLSMYGGGMGGGPYNYGGRYGRGPNQMSNMSPWNYGNFYMGNTTMQMMPYMQRKVAKFAQRQAMSPMGGGFGMPTMPMMPMMPMMPCLSAACSLPMAAPMIAAATPLPIAFNPLVQGMYPIAGMNCGSWMSPSSFMSALSSGPMAYRPPATIEFPNNVGMVTTLPYGTPNPLLSLPSFGGFSPQYNFGGGMSCCCSFCSPCIAPPAISYYPRPVSVPQPCPVPYSVPVPIPNIQQVPVPRPVSVIAPPIIAGGNQGFPIPTGAPLLSSQGGLIQGGMGQQLVMASNQNSTIQSLLKDETSTKFKRRHSSARKFIDQSRRTKAQKLAASLSNLGLEKSFPTRIPSSRHVKRSKSTRMTSFS